TDGTPRDLYDTTARITSPGLDPLLVHLDQVAPGTYEAPLGELGPGAYAMRIDQTQPGKTPLGRTVVLVAPTPAEYRLLGTNDRLLAALRDATGGTAIAPDPTDPAAAKAPWTHDLASTTAARELWPWLVLLALLLWPIDVGIRRLSIGRRDLSLAQAWILARWQRRGRAAERTASLDAMLAARSRAGGRRTRDTLAATAVDGAESPANAESSVAAASGPAPASPAAPSSPSSASTPPVTPARPAAPTSVASTPAAQPGRPTVAPAPAPRPASTPPPGPKPPTSAAPPPPGPKPAAAARPAAPATPPPPAPTASPADEGDTLARLRDAKRRARR
ncbi:MAG: hypothetical protein U0869_26230, partial [Chloroflexota bacterium]